jgi:hypothetical protein
LENAARQAVFRLIGGGPITAIDCTHILDWLDKVRVGMWLASLYLLNNPSGIKPNFAIKLRAALKDRMVAVYRCSTTMRGLDVLGFQTPCFHHLPSCFTLRINDTFLLNISADFLLARRFGLPHPSDRMITRAEGLEFKLVRGTEQLVQPLLELPLAPYELAVYQASWRAELTNEKSDFYKTPYVEEIGLTSGISRINLTKPAVEKDGIIQLLGTGDCFNVDPSRIDSIDKMFTQCIKQTLQIQVQLFDYLYSPSTESQQMELDDIRRMQLALLQNA